VSEDLIDIDSPPEVIIDMGGTVEWRGTVPAFVPANTAAWLTALGRLIDQHVTLTIARMSKRRSNAQNRFYWGVVLATLLGGFRKKAADLGERCAFRDKEHVHEAMKFRFLGVEVLTLPGTKAGTIEAPASTTRLTTVQFNAYWRAIAAWAALECGIYIPEPNERFAEAVA
jgi:hypothetical protein